MSMRTKWGFASACLVAVGLFWGCGGSLGGSSGGESHFLIQCDDSCSDGLSCIAGVCTRGCVVDEGGCDDLHADAECTDSVEPGEVAICDLACSDDGDCASLGANYSCEAGQCRGTTNVATSGSGGSSSNGGSGGTSSDTSSSSGATTTSGGPTTGGGGAGDSCEHLFQEYPNGATFDNHAGCGSCTCSQGEAACDEGGCPVGIPVFACPSEVRTDPVELNSAFIQGDLLLLDVSYGGGCEQHDFGLCYEPTLGESETPGAILGSLRLIHDSHDDPCEAYPSETLHFNLEPYADYVMGELDIPGGLVETSFGHYAFGELDCDLANWAATKQVVEAADQTLNFGCTEDSDCTWATNELTCFIDCSQLIAVGGQDRFETTLDHVQLGVCDQYDANGCPPPPTPVCDAWGPLACVEGRCVELEE